MISSRHRRKQSPESRSDEPVDIANEIVRVVLDHYPETQAIYMFGSFGAPGEWPDSDVDIAVLLPPDQAREHPQLAMTPCHLALSELLGGKQVDLVNIRQVSTVFQKEIIQSERRVYCNDEYAADEFEMLTLSYYQKLNEERAGIIEEFRKTGKAYPL